MQSHGSDKLLLVDITDQAVASGEMKSPGSIQTAVTPNNPPWNSWIALLVWMLSVFLVVVVPSIVVLAYVAPMKGRFDGQEAMIEFLKTDPTAVLLQVLAIVPVHLLTILICWAVVTRFRTFPFWQTLGWRAGGMRWWYYVAILGSFFALSVVVMNFFPETDNDLLRILKSSRSAVVVVAILATFTAPLVEEVVYRGVLYSAFQRAMSPSLAIAVVTALFALVHFPQYWPSYSTLFLLTILSLALTIIRARSGNLLPCIILHTLFNGLQSLMLIVEPYLPNPTPKPDALPATIAIIVSLIK